MVMSWIFTGMLLGSVLAAALSGKGGALSAAAVEGAQAGVKLALSITGAVCLWSGVGKLMEKTGLTALLPGSFLLCWGGFCRGRKKTLSWQAV